MKVTDSVTEPGHGPVFICDFSPPRGADPDLLSGARLLAAADFICVAYNPGKLVRLDSVAAARHLKQSTGRDVIFNLSPRDMNRIALESKLLGAHLMGLENVLVVQGDPFNQQDGLRAAEDYTATELIAAVKRLNQGLDYRDSKLRSATDLCPGAGLDLNRDLEDEVHLTHRKIEAGAEFLVSQPVFDVARIADFVAQYAAETGQPLRVPVFWGIQVLARDGVLFSNVPEDFLRDLETAATVSISPSRPTRCCANKASTRYMSSRPSSAAAPATTRPAAAFCARPPPAAKTSQACSHISRGSAAQYLAVQ